MAAGRLIVFEGVDGAGKTTALARVAKLLADGGTRVFLPRTGKEHASRPTRMIRQLTRDPRNLDLEPRAELLLYCAREAQVHAELVRPALSRGETVLVDRSFLTPLVLGMARGLSADECAATTRLASAGLEPELTLVFDVHPRTSRLRKRLERLRSRAAADGGRKGLAGSAFKERVRDGYVKLAAERGYPVFHVERATPDELAQRVAQVVLHGARASALETPLDSAPRWLVPSDWELLRGLHSLPLAEALFFCEGLRSGRELRRQALDAEPVLVANTLDLSDPLREALFARDPGLALHGLYRQPVSGPDDIRLRAVSHAPAEAIAALRYVRDARSDALRKEHAATQPDAVLSSLAGSEDALALQLRDACWPDASDDARAQSLVGCNGERARMLREELFERSPVSGLASLRGAHGGHDSWTDAKLERYAKVAPKLVLGALAGRSDARAYALRDQLFETGREVIDSVRGLGDEPAFRLRERALERWPSTVAHSLLGLPEAARVRDIYQRCRALARGDLHVHRRLALLDEAQAQAPAPTTTQEPHPTTLQTEA